MTLDDLAPQSFQTGSLDILAALGEAGDSQSSITQAYSGSFLTEHDADNVPSLTQQAALGALLQLRPGVVLAWLTILRSSEPGEFQSKLLSSDQVAALIELKDCPESLVEAWLHEEHLLARPDALEVPQKDDSQQTTSLPALDASYNQTADTTARNSTLSGASTSFYGYSTGYSTPVSSYAPTHSYPSSLNEIASEGPRPSSLASASHPHGCPICQKTIGTCDGWKRHMKEHETLYPCKMCATSGKTRSFSRKLNLQRHLETHGFSNDESSTLADKWKKTHEKKYFGCGFCVILCTSLTEQLNHIDSEHFKYFRSISEWDTNKVIRGLLMQPELSLTVQRLLRQPFGISENLSWHPSIIHELQLRLQESNEATEHLARITIFQIDWDLTASNANEPTSALSFGYTGQNTPALTSSQHQIGTVNGSHKPWTGFASPYKLSDSQNPQYHQHPLQLTAPTHGRLNIPNQQLAIFNSDDNTNHSKFNNNQQMDLDTQSSSHSNNTRTQRTHHPLLPTWEHRALRDVDERLNESMPGANEVSVNGVWPPSPFSVPINSATTPRSSDPSYPHTVPSSVPRAAASDEENVQLKKQRSRKKLASHYGAPDLDFEELQYLMRDHDRSRSIRRQR